MKLSKELCEVANRFCFAITVATSLILSGCDYDPLKKVNVSGTVTFDGGPCPGPGRVTFSPIEVAEGAPKRPAVGGFKADGSYEAMSFRPGDGLVPGTYMASVACFDSSKLSGSPSDDEFRNANYVSEDFKPVELIVEAGSGSIEFDIDVPKRVQ